MPVSLHLEQLVEIVDIKRVQGAAGDRRDRRCPPTSREQPNF